MFAVVYCPDFFIQCERLFRPELLGKILVIASSDGDGGSRLIASSDEAQALGLVPGTHGTELAKIFAAISTHHSFEVCSPNFELYADLSERLRKSLALLAPSVTMHANDDVYLNLEGLNLASNLSSYGKMLRSTLMQWLGISAFIGIGPTKALAKLASNAALQFNEFQAVVDLSLVPARHALLQRIAVSNIVGISQTAAAKLSEINIQTALELSQAPKAQVRRRCSVVIERIALELSGLACQEISLKANTQRVVAPLRDQADARSFIETKRVLRAQVARAIEQLNSLANSCETVTVALTTAPLDKQYSPFETALTLDLVKPTSSIGAIGQLASQMLESLWHEQTQFRSLRLSLEGLSPNESDQVGLFVSSTKQSKPFLKEEPPTIIKLETALCTESAKLWRDKRSLLSPSFTTKWGDIPRVS